MLRSTWAFARPHTIIGTTLAVIVFYVLTASVAGRYDTKILLGTLIAGLAVNLYVVGINQITDVEIDRINKPYLPLASGAFSMRTGMAIVGMSAVVALCVSALQNIYLFWTIAIILAIGTAYSLPPLRLKQSAFWAAASIITARAVVFNLGLTLSYAAALLGRPTVPARVLLFVGFMFGFVTVIAIMKDVPDIDGDRRHKIFTLVLRLGARRTLLLCRLLLTTCYVATAAAAALAGVGGISTPVLVTCHVVALLALWVRGYGLQAEDPASVSRFYMFVWKLFYGEFLAFLVACLAA
ncbi:MAG: homogentisate phytyltransferase [Byssovorax sp.]